MNLTSNQKGNIAQKFFELLMTKEKIPCFKPINDHLYDYVIVLNDKFIRIEVKSSNTNKNGAVIFCTNHSSGRHNIVPYTKKEIDYIFVYSLTGHYAFLPSSVWENKRNLSLRYKKSNNGANYPMFQDYSLEELLKNLNMLE